jgi:hypothetical protein
MAAAAKAKSKGPVTTFIRRPKKKRPGVHAKTKQSKNRNATLYKKPYVGQG